MQRQNVRVTAQFIEYATVVRIVRFKNEGRRLLQMRVCDRDQCAGRARSNQKLQRARFWIDLDVIEARNLLSNRSTQRAHALGRAVMIAACFDAIAGSLREPGIDR